MQAVTKAELEVGVRAILRIAEQAGIQLPGLLREDPMKDVPDVTFDNAVAAYHFDPKTYRSLDAMRWLLRHRRTNGLMDCGAVSELKHKTGQKRPTLRIHHRQWVAFSKGLTY